MINSLKPSTPFVSEGIHLSKHNQQLVDDFLNSLPLIKAKRRAKYISKLAAMGEDLGDFEKVTRLQLRKYVETIDAAEDLKLWTKRDYKLVAKKFFKWLHNHEFVDWIRLGRIKTTVSPEDIFTEAELSRMREACSFKQRSSIRDKAIIEALYESAMRPHEVLNLKKNNVAFDDYGAQLHIERGKTGPRTVRVINAAPLLANWIENHPLREKDSALWVDLSMNTKFEQLTWHGLDRLIERLAKVARIEKVVNSYTFRHTRLTNLANFMTEAQLCEFAGWEQGSDMPRMYIHLTGRDVDKALLKAHGLIKSEEVELPKPRRCVRCSAMNSPTGEICTKCGMALSLEAAMKKDEEQKNTQKEFADVKLQLEEIWAAIERKAKPKVTKRFEPGAKEQVIEKLRAEGLVAKTD